MHELSLALSIVETATEAAKRAGARNVIAVRVRIGVLAAVSAEALTFHFSEAVRDTLLADAKLSFESVAVRLHCPVCGFETEPADALRFLCGRCGEPTGNLVAGRELEVDSIEVT
jgi:hydrogenase nickel incorporation protein HypA/HybF